MDAVAFHLDLSMDAVAFHLDLSMDAGYCIFKLRQNL
jgi:hypothetical protein